MYIYIYHKGGFITMSTGRDILYDTPWCPTSSVTSPKDDLIGKFKLGLGF